MKPEKAKKVIIAIDGPSGAGKGTVAHYLAKKFNLKILDTGLLYRALAKSAIGQGLNDQDTHQIIDLAKSITINHTQQDGLRDEAVAGLASKIAAIPEVREILNTLQRDFAHSNPGNQAGVILDGRDIGTVICPEADCKIYLTADQEIRALRRTQQEGNICQIEVQRLMSERDKRDSTRQTAPLNAAKDAYIIDTTHLTIDEVCQKASYYVQKSCLPGTLSA